MGIRDKATPREPERAEMRLHLGERVMCPRSAVVNDPRDFGRPKTSQVYSGKHSSL